MKQVLYKYSSLLITVTGAVLMVLSVYYPSPFLQLETLGVSLTIMVSGLLLFFAGSILMGKYDEEFMEKMMEKIGRILELV